MTQQLLRILAFFLIISSIVAGRTYYEILNVQRSADIDTIKRNYRSLAKKYHPDKNKSDPKANEKFIEITRAYETLSDDSKRREYDYSLPTARASRSASTANARGPPRRDANGFDGFPNYQNTFVFRTNNGQSFSYSSSSSSKGNTAEDFFRYYFQEQYDYHQQHYQSKGGVEGFIIWSLETLHIFMSICLTLAIPLTVLFLLLSILYHGCSNFISSMIFQQQHQKYSASINKPFQPTKNPIAARVQPKPATASTAVQTPDSKSKPKAMTPASATSGKENQTPDFKTPPANHPRDRASTPEERAMERLRQRHLDEGGVLVVVACSLAGWNVLTRVKPFFNHDRHLRFVQHITGSKDETLPDHDCDMLALARRGSKWTPFYLSISASASDDEGPGLDEDVNRFSAVHIIGRAADERQEEEESTPHRRRRRRVLVDAAEGYDHRIEVEEWLVKLLNGEIHLRNISSHPLPIIIDK
jgi:curved DNA-binding protein CbpA